MKVLKCRWPVYSNRVYPIRDFESNLMAFPTVVIAGEALKDVAVFSLPLHVVAGFQATLRVSYVEVRKADIADFSIEAKGEKSFVLKLPYELADYAETVSCLQRGMAAISAQNRANFVLAVKEVSHVLNNKVQSIMGQLELFELLSEQKICAEQIADAFLENLSRISRLKTEALEKGLLDSAVLAVKRDLEELNALVFTAAEVLLSIQEKEAGNDLQAAIAAARSIPAVITRGKAILSDLGQFDVVKPMTFADVILLKETIKDLLPERDDLFSHKILGNRIMICQIFEEMLSNAQRGAQGHKLKLEMSVDRANGLLHLTLINQVREPKMRQFLEKDDQLFDDWHDEDGHIKQQIFFRGVTSRSGEGGLGLAVLWELVVLRLAGEIHADYHPQANEFSMTVSFRLADNN